MEKKIVQEFGFGFGLGLESETAGCIVLLLEGGNIGVRNKEERY